MQFGSAVQFIWGITSYVIFQMTSRKSRRTVLNERKKIKFRKTMIIRTLSHSSEAWISTKEKQRKESEIAEIKFLKDLVVCTLKGKI